MKANKLQLGKIRGKNLADRIKHLKETESMWNKSPEEFEEWIDRLRSKENEIRQIWRKEREGLNIGIRIYPTIL